MQCPFCGEDVERGALECPACGEHLDADLAQPAASSRSLVALVVLAFVAAALLLGGFAFAALLRARAGAGKTKCSNNLRQFGLAAIQYADDKRFFPHVGPLKELDGGIESSDTPKVARALHWYGYHDNPEGWICPYSSDVYLPVDDPAVRDQPRLWFWDGGSAGRVDRSPYVDDLRDPLLSETTELSYGWTRRAMNTNVRSDAALGADRALRVDAPQHDVLVGNHEEGWNLLRADATVEYLPVGGGTGARLVSTEGDGYKLAVRAQ